MKELREVVGFAFNTAMALLCFAGMILLIAAIMLALASPLILIIWMILQL